MRFEDKIRTLAIRWPISVTSWIRSLRRNIEVGGASNSRHLLGLAVDVVLDPTADRISFIADAKRLQLEVVDEADHLHVQEP